MLDGPFHPAPPWSVIPQALQAPSFLRLRLGQASPWLMPWSGITSGLQLHLFPPPLQLHHCPHSHWLRPRLVSPISISAPQACGSALPLHSSGVTLGLLLLSSTWVSTSPGSTSVSRDPGSSIHRFCHGHSSYWVCFGSLHGPFLLRLPHGLLCKSLLSRHQEYRRGEYCHRSCILYLRYPCQVISVSSPGDLFCASYLGCSVLLW